MMSLNYSKKLLLFFDSFDSYVNYPDKNMHKEICIKRAFWLQPQAFPSMHGFQK